MDDWRQKITEIFGKYGIRANCSGNFVEFETPDGDRVRLGREHNLVDYLVVRINGQQVHQG